MSPAALHRGQAVAGLIVLSVAAGAAAEPAAAALPLNPQVFRPPVRLTKLPPPRIALPETFNPSAIYRTDEPAVVGVLDDSRTAVVDDVDAIATRVATDAEGEAGVKACAGEGLKGAAEGYAERVDEAAASSEGVLPPDFNEVVDLVAGCLESQLDVPVGDAADLAKELADAEAQRGLEALRADGSAAVLAGWMAASGDEIAASAGSEVVVADPEPTPESAPEPGSSPPWAAIFGILAVAAIGAVVYFGRRSGSR